MENIDVSQEANVPNVVESGVSPERKEEVSRFVEDLAEWAKSYREKA